jgi:hypothetical protein
VCYQKVESVTVRLGLGGLGTNRPGEPQAQDEEQPAMRHAIQVHARNPPVSCRFEKPPVLAAILFRVRVGK